MIDNVKNRRPVHTLLISLVILVFFVPSLGYAKTGIVNTKHNLSASSEFELMSPTETRICIFCHTPHNASPRSPLWNKALDPLSYTLYNSSTLSATVSPPSGPTRLCLSCHDGQLALGAVLNPTGGIGDVKGEITIDRDSFIGLDISNDHPISFSYYDALADLELHPSPPIDLPLYGRGNIHCSTCHDPHSDAYENFLVVDNIKSALCLKCHNKSGWASSSHSLSGKIWNGLPPDPWPKTPWITVADNGCENCHTPHSAEGPKRLMYFQEEELNCYYTCHNGNVAAKNIEGEFQKVSRHPVQATTIGVTPNHHDPAESSVFLKGHVECADCHDPHVVNNTPASGAPYISGRLESVSGVDKDGTETGRAVFEYEICFKCHGDSTEIFPYIPRVVDENNTRYEFSTLNPSYHPVVDTGKNGNMPSLPSNDEPLTVSSIIYCTDCHDSDVSPKIGGTGPRGPHGSNYKPLLRQQYETDLDTPNTYSSYALCYRCHSDQSILLDQSFKKNAFTGRGGHKFHLDRGYPCSSCHDPHGVKDDPLSGDHTHLINFDTRSVTPLAGHTYPIFEDTGVYSGSCTLVCHDSLNNSYEHNNVTYP